MLWSSSIKSLIYQVTINQVIQKYKTPSEQMSKEELSKPSDLSYSI